MRRRKEGVRRRKKGVRKRKKGMRRRKKGMRRRNNRMWRRKKGMRRRRGQQQSEGVGMKGGGSARDNPLQYPLNVHLNDPKNSVRSVDPNSSNILTIKARCLRRNRGERRSEI